MAIVSMARVQPYEVLCFTKSIHWFSCARTGIYKCNRISPTCLSLRALFLCKLSKSVCGTAREGSVIRSLWVRARGGPFVYKGNASTNAEEEVIVWVRRMWSPRGVYMASVVLLFENFICLNVRTMAQWRLVEVVLFAQYLFPGCYALS